MPQLLLRLLRRLRGLALLVPGRGDFHAAGVRTKLSVLFFLTTFSAVAAIGLYGYFNASTAYRERAIGLLVVDRDEVATKIDDFFGLLRDNLGFINRFYALLRFAYWRDLGDAAKMEEWRNVAGDTLCNFAENYRYYYKIRFFGRDGQETLHVQTDHATGKARLLADNELQSDVGREYVDAGLKLRRGEIYRQRARSQSRAWPAREALCVRRAPGATARRRQRCAVWSDRHQCSWLRRSMTSSGTLTRTSRVAVSS